MNKILISIILLTLIFIGNLKYVSAAEINHLCFKGKLEKLYKTEGGCYLFLKGEIIKGDYKKVLAEVKKVNDQKKVIGKLFLASPGGDIEEAIKIGRFVRKKIITTDTPNLIKQMYNDKFDCSYLDLEACRRESGTDYESFFQTIYLNSKHTQQAYSSKRHLQNRDNPYLIMSHNKYTIYSKDIMCASACTLISLAGLEREDKIIGVHFLSMNNKSLNYETLEKELLEGTNEIDSYLTEIRSPDKFREAMLSASSTEMIWMKEEENEEFEGYIYDRIFMEYVLSKCPPPLSQEDKYLLSHRYLFIEYGNIYDENSSRPVKATDTDKRLAKALKREDEAHKSCLLDLQMDLRVKAQLK